MARDNKRSADSGKNDMKQQNQKKRKKRMSGGQKGAVGVLLGLVVGITCMWVIYAGVGQSMVVDKSQYDRYVKAESIIDYVNQNYYVETDENSISDGMYKGIVEGLDDPYSSYMTVDEYKKYEEDANGEYCGVGLVITINDKNQIEVVSVIDGSPAEKAKLKTGDVIRKIDGEDYSGKFAKAADALKGEKGTEVAIEFARDGKVKDISLKREDIKADSVSSKMLDDSIGYVRISQFIKNTGEDFIKAVEKLEKKDAKALIIDLRNNGGGRVDECLKVADKLLGEGVIVCYVDNKGNKTYSNSDKEKTKLKYVLLVNEGTASASEIITAAVKDNKGGKIVGQNTFGKGVIQKVTKMDDGSAIKLTVMQYLSPDGTAIHKKGIKPDYEVKNSDKGDKQLEKAQDILTD